MMLDNLLNNLLRRFQELLEAANRWTDNIFQIKSWCARKFNVEPQALDKQFNIPDDLDYLE